MDVLYLFRTVSIPDDLVSVWKKGNCPGNSSMQIQRGMQP